jgi:hypothetical protein
MDRLAHHFLGEAVETPAPDINRLIIWKRLVKPSTTDFAEAASHFSPFRVMRVYASEFDMVVLG